MWREWTTETLDEFEAAIHEADDPTDPSEAGLLTIVDAGELDMDALATALA